MVPKYCAVPEPVPWDGSRLSQYEHAPPYTCYLYADFGDSASQEVGINKVEAKKLGPLGPRLLEGGVFDL